MTHQANPKVAIVYHSGFGHTHVLAEKVAQGVRESGAQPVLLRIENAAQDFAPIFAEIASADAVVFGAPTYMGSASAAFQAFAEASAKAWFTADWKDKLAAGFTNSGSLSGDKLNTLTNFAVLAAQHGMIWVGTGLPPAIASGEVTPASINRVGSSLGVMAQSDNAGTDVTPPEGDRETARLFGARIAWATRRWLKGQAETLAEAA